MCQMVSEAHSMQILCEMDSIGIAFLCELSIFLASIGALNI